MFTFKRFKSVSVELCDVRQHKSVADGSAQLYRNTARKSETGDGHQQGNVHLSSEIRLEKICCVRACGGVSSFTDLMMMA